MSELDLARWQFGITTVYHFIFVPLTLGLSLLVAGMQTAWMVKKDPVVLEGFDSGRRCASRSPRCRWPPGSWWPARWRTGGWPPT